ncbi:hypothetical protein NCC49_005403 [Naganishia albida]|nr:hypothetical protein NCC49_005403 [Naganishia albida]
MSQPAPSPIRAQTHTHHRLFLGPLPRESLQETRKPSRPRASNEAALVPSTSHARGAGARRFSFFRHRASASPDTAQREREQGAPFFVIGREFQPASASDDAHDEGSSSASPPPPVVLINRAILDGPSNPSEPTRPRPVSRPSLYPRKSTDRASFRTARSAAATPGPGPSGPSGLSKPIGTPGTTRTGTTTMTDFFSAKSSVSDLEEEVASNEAIIAPPTTTSAFARSPSAMNSDPPITRIRTKLRSALRKKRDHDDDDDVDDDAVMAREEGGTKGKGKQKRRTVYFPLDEPVEPDKVLARRGSAVAGTSAGVVEEATATATATERRQMSREGERLGASMPEEGEGKNVVVEVNVADDMAEEGNATDMKVPTRVRALDRMLVAVGKNTHPHLTGYDESQARRKPSERVKAVEEYLVVYRQGWVELYKEWSTPLGRTFRKTKRLAFAIPLLRGVTTFSVFSRRDMSFALCLDTAVMRDELERAQREERRRASSSSGGRSGVGRTESRGSMVDRMKQTKEFRWVQDQASGNGGKNRSLVLVFIGRERTRMLDWSWRIWNDLGGTVPDTLRVQVPIFDSIIDLPRPADDMTGLRAFSRSRILLDVFTALRSQLPDYDDLVLRERERAGTSRGELRLELAWEADLHLDWVPPFAEWSVEDRKREWAVLAGLTMIQPNDPCELLLLPIRHDANDLKLADGMRLSEPPGIEGFLHKLTGGKGAPVKQRVYIHSQSGYLLSSSPRHAQAPLAPLSDPSDDPSTRRAFHADERDRNTHNMLYSDGLIDFRSIVRLLPPNGSSEMPFERQASGEEDRAEESDNLRTTVDRLTRTQLAVVLDSGEIIWLEASDEKVALEWFSRIRELCEYWAPRQRVDARDRMNLIREIETSIHTAGGADSELARDNLTCRIANWCPYDRCNTILHCGRLYLKPSPADQFRESFCMLVPGYLIECSVTADCYHRRKYRYSLAETYVCPQSAAQQHVRLRVDEPMETRLYQDGLSSSDGVEDCSFVIWIRREAKVDAIDQAHVQIGRHAVGSKGRRHTASRLAKKPAKMIVCRARCKLERDLWVRALSIEIESHSREHTEQQNRLRTGEAVSI